jgi:hypothetical protein
MEAVEKRILPVELGSFLEVRRRRRRRRGDVGCRSFAQPQKYGMM